ncbi:MULTISPECIES: SUKH-4 family immunity protein [Streptomyces]|uniref:SUKH-4 family immunity protein n=1 Tax=Streptomyces TaxID=1883 RepID=UPI000A3789A0|nr:MULTISPECIES: SUKH-4 family immunity protein [Streptomyces]MDN5380530.1 SUKH-4 family immunity protein [Streptomyces sp. LB8]
MTEHVPDPSAAHFGPDGMRRFTPAGAEGVRLPDAARTALAETGVPLHVTPYFTAAGDTDALPLGVFAGHRGRRPPAGTEDWLRIGTDRLAHLCVRPDGAVQAVFLEQEADDMFVSSDVPAFNASLAALDRRMPVIAASTSLAVAAAAFRELNAELRRIDAAAFAERESWWPRVLDDVRHTFNFPFSSAFEYVDDTGAKQVVTDATGPGRAHPEELLWQRLRARGVAPEQVRRVHCELEPCMMPGHYCAVWLQATFPHAEFTHSFDYGTTAGSREEGFKQLLTHAARQAGRL